MKLKALLAASLLATVATTAVAGPYETLYQNAQDARASLVESYNFYSNAEGTGGLNIAERYVFTKMQEAPGYANLTPEGKVKILVDYLPQLKKKVEEAEKNNGSDQEFKGFLNEMKVFIGTMEITDPEAAALAQTNFVNRLAVADRLFQEDVPNYNAAVREFKNYVQKLDPQMFMPREQALLAHLEQTTLSYDLLKDLNSAQADQGFVNLQGGYAKSQDASDLANFAHFGYKLQASDKAAVAGFVTAGHEKTQTQNTAVSGKTNTTNVGVGLYAAADAGNFKFSGLLQAYAGDSAVKNVFDVQVEDAYKALLVENIKLEDKDPLKNGHFEDSVNVNKGVVSFVGKAEYAYKVKDGLTVTPALFYQALKTTAQEEVTVKQRVYSAPAMFTNQVGAAVAVNYQVAPAVNLGLDVAGSYLHTSAGDYTYQVKELDKPAVVDGSIFLQDSYKTVTKTAPYNVTNYRIATQAKLAYTVSPSTTVTAKAGYTYFTGTKAHSGTYGVDVAFKF